MIEIAREKAAVAKVENVIFEQTDIFDSEFSKESYAAADGFGEFQIKSHNSDCSFSTVA
jgi:hypothetical protein